MAMAQEDKTRKQPALRKNVSLDNLETHLQEKETLKITTKVIKNNQILFEFYWGLIPYKSWWQWWDLFNNL